MRATGISCFYDRRGKLWGMRRKGATDKEEISEGTVHLLHKVTMRGNPSMHAAAPPAPVQNHTDNKASGLWQENN